MQPDLLAALNSAVPQAAAPSDEQPYPNAVHAPDCGPALSAPSAHRLRIVHISDTHNKHWDLLRSGAIAPGDVFVHSGDFATRLRRKDLDAALDDFNRFLGELPHGRKIFVAGNHEIALNDVPAKEVQARLSHCTDYLQDASAYVDGVHFYGSPWTRSRGMGFSASSGELARHWSCIPEDVDVLITHSPPFATLDLAWSNRGGTKGTCQVCGKKHPRHSHWGCQHLMARIREVRPHVHLFGHVHDDAGFVQQDGTLFLNAAADMSQRGYFFDFLYSPSPPKKSKKGKKCTVS